jgi:hypothetical protein
MKISAVCLFFITTLFSISVTCQNSQHYNCLLAQIHGSYTNENLKDSIKTVKFKYSNLKKSLSNNDQSRVMINNDIRRKSYFEVDKRGRITTLLEQIPDFEYISNIDYSLTEDYIYDDKDLAVKNNCKSTLKQYYPVKNHNLLLKLNRIKVQKEEVMIKNKVWQQYDEDLYKYIYDNTGRITEEQRYVVYRFDEAIKDKSPTIKDLFTRKLFIYNAIGQVESQKIICGEYGHDISYSDMGTQCGFCDDLQLKYSYDSLGRIIDVELYGCKKIVAKESYSYHPTKDYVEKVKCYVTGPGEMANSTKNFIKTYNEEGDIIKKEFVPDNPEQNLAVKVRYYTYEYDSHNNWIKCNMFLEGTPDGEPTLVAERKIEYYN